MNADLRRDLLRRLAEVKKSDGWVTQKAANELFCECLTELVSDTVYAPVYRSAVEPQDDPVVNVDRTSPAEVP